MSFLLSDLFTNNDLIDRAFFNGDELEKVVWVSDGTGYTNIEIYQVEKPATFNLTVNGGIVKQPLDDLQSLYFHKTSYFGVTWGDQLATLKVGDTFTSSEDPSFIWTITNVVDWGQFVQIQVAEVHSMGDGGVHAFSFTVYPDSVRTVYERAYPAGSITLNNTAYWIVPRGIAQVTVCLCGGGGGGGAMRGGGGGGSGAVTQTVNVNGGDELYFYRGLGGAGSDNSYTRASNGGSSLLSTNGGTFGSINAQGGQGGISDARSLGYNGGGYGGDGLPDEAGGNSSGCGGSHSGGNLGGSSGGGGAGGYGRGGHAALYPSQKVGGAAPANSGGGGGGTWNDNIGANFGFKGGAGGSGKCVISWTEQT